MSICLKGRFSAASAVVPISARSDCVNPASGTPEDHLPHEPRAAMPMKAADMKFNVFGVDFRVGRYPRSFFPFSLAEQSLLFDRFQLSLLGKFNASIREIEQSVLPGHWGAQTTEQFSSKSEQLGKGEKDLIHNLDFALGVAS